LSNRVAKIEKKVKAESAQASWESVKKTPKPKHGSFTGTGLRPFI